MPKEFLMPNRLAQETSPYLRQHADNPVDWYPWGEEAFAKARAEDKPILLSVGYSACHWCHVMAHESFEDPATAELMNRLFVNVKVDREERPDVDDVYMQAVQAMTGHGGWPMTVFMLPDAQPFWGGTYFPREARPGLPAFRDVLQSLNDAYHNRRDEVEKAASQLSGALDNAILNIGATEDALNSDLLDRAFRKITANFDPTYGGFGGAPKFPQPMNIAWLLAYHSRTGSPKALSMATYTLEQMARGGIYDQIGGGFARYSVDAVWLVPHFEKMLYDNAQLSRLYVRGWQLTGDIFLRSIAEETYDYILREMTSAEGGFYSATDADSEGEEGKFFVWSIAEIKTLLPDDDARIACEVFGITPNGNFEGHNILFRNADDSSDAKRLGMSVETLQAALARIKDTLFAARTQRIAPGLDDKILTSWNGMMLASLAEAARTLRREDYRAAAVRAADFLLATMTQSTPEGLRVLRTYNHGKAKLNGYLEDYACLADALLEVYMTTFDQRYFEAARDLSDFALAHFRAEDGGFFDTSDDHEKLIVRPRSLQDNAVPSGSAMFTRVLLRLSAYTGDARYDSAARDTLRLLANAMGEYPQAFGEALGSVELIVSSITEVALVGDARSEGLRGLYREVFGTYRPNIIAAHSTTDAPDDHAIPLLASRTLRNGQPAAYVCRNFACQMPVTTPEDLHRQLEDA
jgi:uncharacterized protein YyaL (SSP411 family)